MKPRLSELFSRSVDIGGHHFDVGVEPLSLPVEGSWVTLPDGRVGRVDHVMTEGVLNLGDVAMPATPDAPVALVSVWEGESFGEPVPVAVADLQAAEEPEAARAYGKPKRKPRKRKER
jgi:hypothetical protein